MTGSNPKTSGRLVQFHQDGLTLVVDPERPAWAVVNGVGVRIAELCDGTRPVEEIVRSIAERYSKSPEAIRSHVISFLDMLEKAGLLADREIPEDVQPGSITHVTRLTSASFELTERCNLRCVHCFEGSGKPQNPEPSTDEVIGWMDKFAGIEDININLSGGEMLLRSDWHELIGHVVEMGKNSVVLSNGTTIDDKRASELAELVLGTGIFFQISLDGPRPEVNDPIRGLGSFDAAISGIQALKRHGLTSQIAMSFTPTALNMDTIDQMIDLALELELPKFHISSLTRLGRARLDWGRFAPTVEQQVHFFDRVYARTQELDESRMKVSGDYCTAMYKKVKNISVPPVLGCRLGADVKIDILGDVYPCNPLGFDTKYRMGNIRDMTAEDIIHSPVANGLREQFVPRVEKSPTCTSCAWKLFCSGGCMARADHHFDTIYHGDDMCLVAQKIFPKYLFMQAQEQRSTVSA